ncbi:putative ABC transport system permease protein [Polymorphobacter multimanifer]|uniref:Putative ABC transport system permease protein n=2 Tax=Polymorphobacter multimanifer TaxID=1070431 RepID=A0A841L7Q5_9SPHN|nr:FtsX-like permease family protein [Polymorphobacter multimanifer]MBB6229039.1 putative ABC transport system permease protein [Polymorphobacter multimanifer]
MSPATLAWRNLGRNRLRAGLMIVSVAVAFSLFGALFGFSALLDPDAEMATSRDLVVRHRVNILQMLPVRDGEAIARIPGVESVSHQVVMAGHVGSRDHKLPTMMVSAPAYLAQNADDVLLDAATKATFLRTRDGLIADAATATEQGWKPGQLVTITSPSQPRRDGSADWEYRYVGSFTAADGSDSGIKGAIGHFEYLNEGSALGRDRVHWFGLRTRSAADNDRVAAAIDARFANSDSPTKTEPASAMARAFLSQLVDFETVMRVVVGAAFVAILMVVGNTLAMVVRQRVREIGVLRAIGFPAATVLQVVLGEALLVATIGAVTGLVLAAALVAAVAADMGGGDVSIPAGVVAGGLGLALVFGLVTGLPPALAALRIRPAQAFARS